MNRALGVALTGVGVLGYVAGVLAPYPGRALSLPAVMVGVALLAIGRGGRGDWEDVDANADAEPRGTERGDAERGGPP